MFADLRPGASVAEERFESDIPGVVFCETDHYGCRCRSGRSVSSFERVIFDAKQARHFSCLRERTTLAGPAVEVGCPIVHEPPPPFEQVRPRVGRLHLVLDHVGERGLDDFTWMIRFLGGPIPERRPEAVAARRRPRGTGASSGTSTSLSTSRSASGTRAGCRRRASAPRRGPPAPGRRAGPGARASPSSAWPGPSTPRRPCRSRPMSLAGPHPTARPSTPGTRTPA